MPLTTIYDGGTRIVGDATALEESLHPSVMAYVNAMRSATGGNYAMTVNEIDAVNNMVKAMVANGIWSKMKAVYPVIGGTAAAHKYNLVDPRDADAAYRLAFNGGGWAHSSTGMTPNGTSSWANTFLNATIVQTTNHLSYYSRTQSPVGTTVEIGVYNDGLPCTQLRAAANYICGNISGAGIVSFTSLTDARGFWLGVKTASNNRSVYLNGNRQNNSTTNDTTGNPNGNLFVGARNRLGNPEIFSNKQCAFASIGDGLTDAEARAFSIIVQAFQTKLGRQV